VRFRLSRDAVLVNIPVEILDRVYRKGQDSIEGSALQCVGTVKADLIDSTKRDATKCLYCCTTAGMAMWQFTEIFADEIEKVT
jgi:hypothetical protein